jgi:tetratricopeptide (TPR) repeat protein
MDETLKQTLKQAREHYQRGDYEGCESLLVPLLPQLSDFADVHHMLGFIAHSKGKLEDAAIHFERALDINPRYSEAALNLAITYNELGRYDEARSLQERVRERNELGVDRHVRGKIANMHAQIAEAYVEAQMLRDAIWELERAVLLAPDFADLRYRLGVLYREFGQPHRARLEFEAAKRIRGSFVPARLALAMSMLVDNHKEQAEEELRGVLDLEPENKIAWMYLRMLKANRV